MLQGIDYETRRKQVLGLAIEHGHMDSPDASPGHIDGQAELNPSDPQRGEKVIPFIIAGGCILIGLMPLCVVHRVNVK